MPTVAFDRKIIDKSQKKALKFVLSVKIWKSGIFE
jgi:hypothetical protein